MLAGFEEPTSGQILISGQSVAGIPPHKRDVNTVFQAYALFPHMTVAENVAYGLRQKRTGKAEIAQRVAEALDMVKMTPLANRKPSQMSGGQQQRVAVARALVNRPSLLLLDEPLGALDRKLREEMQIELKLLQNQLGITFVFVTHDQEEALSMSDRIAVMLDGRIEQLARPLHDLRAPAVGVRRRVHRAAELLRGDRRGRVARSSRDRGWKIRTAREESAAVGDGLRALAAVRPEAIHVAESAPGRRGEPDGGARSPGCRTSATSSSSSCSRGRRQGDPGAAAPHPGAAARPGRHGVVLLERRPRPCLRGRAGRAGARRPGRRECHRGNRLVSRTIAGRCTDE